MQQIPFSTLDTFHSVLINDDDFMEALMSVAQKVAQETMDAQPCYTDEEDVSALAYELCNRISVN